MYTFSSRERRSDDKKLVGFFTQWNRAETLEVKMHEVHSGKKKKKKLQAAVDYEKHIEGGWIGVNTNLINFLNKYEYMMQTVTQNKNWSRIPSEGL